jgi:hypothetical protein
VTAAGGALPDSIHAPKSGASAVVSLMMMSRIIKHHFT